MLLSADSIPIWYAKQDCSKDKSTSLTTAIKRKYGSASHSIRLRWQHPRSSGRRKSLPRQFTFLLTFVLFPASSEQAEAAKSLPSRFEVASFFLSARAGLHLYSKLPELRSFLLVCLAKRTMTKSMAARAQILYSWQMFIAYKWASFTVFDSQRHKMWVKQLRRSSKIASTTEIRANQSYR